MKNFWKEILIFLLQLLLFYVFPLSAGPTDALGMVVIIILITFVLSFLMGILSGKKIKYLYPVLCAVLFIPSVFIYYNDSALIHAVWYLVDSAIGLGLGSVIRLLLEKGR